MVFMHGLRLAAWAVATATFVFLVLGAALRWLAFTAARKRERAGVFRAVLGGYLGAILGR